MPKSDLKLPDSLLEAKRPKLQPASLGPVDERQRYTIPESSQYLRVSRAYLYRLIERGEIRVIKDGKRTFLPGSEIVRRSTLAAS